MANRSWSRARVFAAILLVQCGIGAGVKAENKTLHWRTGDVVLPEATEDVWSAMRDAESLAVQHIVVQFDGIPGKDARASLASSGLQLLRYVGDGAYFAAVDAQKLNVGDLAGDAGIVGLAELRPEWKVHPALASGETPEWAISSSKAGQAQIALCILLHEDVDPIASESALAVCGAKVTQTLVGINCVVVETPEESVWALAALDAVQWIEPPLPALGENNDQVRSRTGADVAQGPAYDVDGSGVTVMVYDGGAIRTTHLDFEGRVRLRDSTGISTHATHVAGTIGGAGIANALYTGVAPGVQFLSYGLEGTGSDAPLYTNPGDVEADFADAIAEGAMVSNASLGSNVEANGFDCAWQGDYGVTSALLDNIVCGSLGAPIRMVWSAGNERQLSRCDVEGFGDYYSVAPPAGAKNHLTVGAINSNDDSMTNLSSWGPTDDGRLKPIICAPGCQVGDDGGITSCSGAGDDAYITYCGTSMAAPATTGSVALVLDDYQQQFAGQPLPSNALIRALFAHTAVDLGEAGPDYQFGYGSIRVPAALDIMRTAQFDEDYVDQGGVVSHTVTVEAGDAELKTTLAWDDPAALPNTLSALVNDLDLVVTDPNGVRHYPWTLDPLNPANPAVRTAPDRLNNIEQVLVENPIPGDWTISVEGFAVADGPQAFAIIGDGAVNIAAVIGFPDGQPDLVAPGVATDLTVRLAAFGQELLSGTAMLNYRYDDGAFTQISLTPLGDDLYTVTLPARACGEDPEYYVSVDTTLQGVATSPLGAPATVYTHRTGTWTTLFADDFEEDRGWTVQADAYFGDWERADPEEVINGDVVIQPEDDHSPDPGTLCWVTGPLAGFHNSQYDVDGGPSILTSPVFDLSGNDAVISYWRWYHLSIVVDDPFVVEVTNDGENWVSAEEVFRSQEVWVYADWKVSDFVEPTSTVQVRFVVNDDGRGSLMEALVDDFQVSYVECRVVPGDLDGDGDLDLADLAVFTACLTGPVAEPTPECEACDLSGDGRVDMIDAAEFLRLFESTP